MNTPIVDFVRKYADSELVRMHMPGHKGKSFLGCEAFDITEIDGADVLYSPNGIIEQSENNASELFNTAHTFYSTQGSTLCISAMLSIISMRCDAKRKRILAARNVHKAFVHAAALLDLDVSWVYPQSFNHICSADITADDIEKAIAESDEAFDAVYITSPDYLGQILDIKAISGICKMHGIPLLVDNAHGAYLAFAQNNTHPINLGADMCCDSAHKTLPVLTGGAYLHISKEADSSYLEYARSALSLFASTSPSYLILQSLDLCNKYLSDSFRTQLQSCIIKTKAMKEKITSCGFFLLKSEDLKIVVDAKKSGYTGFELGEILEHYSVIPEFVDDDFLVLMISTQNKDTDFERIVKIFSEILPKSEIESKELANRKHITEMSLRQAFFSKRKRINVEDSVGEICAMPLVSCPPAVPIVISGEVILKDDIALFKKYNIDKIDIVVKG